MTDKLCQKMVRRIIDADTDAVVGLAKQAVAIAKSLVGA